MDPEIWGTLPTLFTGLAFTLGLVLVLIAGRACSRATCCWCR
jgi:formate/nitrite transporter FocA (FNT family)